LSQEKPMTSGCRLSRFPLVLVVDPLLYFFPSKSVDSCVPALSSVA
jgi:hypothetical protein